MRFSKRLIDLIEDEFEELEEKVDDERLTD
jgi:hypothetical protein